MRKIVVILWICSFISSYVFLAIFRKAFFLKGCDFLKQDRRILPEGMGIWPGILFIVHNFIQINAMKLSRSKKLRINSYQNVTISLCFLGWIDDMYNVRWRYKITLPFFIYLSSEFSYFFDTFSVCNIHKKACKNLPSHIQNGLIHIFCPNAFNIYSGINGLESCEVFLTGLGLLTIIYMKTYTEEKSTFNNTEIGYKASPRQPPRLFFLSYLSLKKSVEYSQHTNIDSKDYFHIVHNKKFKTKEMFQKVDDMNIISLQMMTMFLLTILPGVFMNFYPSKIFLGNVFCFFSGSVLTGISVLSNTQFYLIFLLLPQIANFLISIPQLIGFYPCPRHRMPVLIGNTLKMSRFAFQKDSNAQTPNFTLLNYFLRFFKINTEFDLLKTALLIRLVTNFVVIYCAYRIGTRPNYALIRKYKLWNKTLYK